MNIYKPEGTQSEIRELTEYKIKQLIDSGEIIEGKVTKSDINLNLYINLGNGITGIIHNEDIEYVKNGEKIKNVAVMSKVGKQVRFKIKELKIDEKGNKIAICSRAEAQKECYTNFVNKLIPGDIIQARVTHIENYGVFCDIGNGIVALLPVENISIARINNPKKTLRTWKDLYVIVKKIDEYGKITLTHKELLGTWEEQITKFNAGETVQGVVKTIEKYGVFVEIAQNLCGLAELRDDINIEDRVNVFIKDINYETMKIKLFIVSSEPNEIEDNNKIKFDYTQKSGHIDEWTYSSKRANKQIKTIF